MSDSIDIGHYRYPCHHESQQPHESSTSSTTGTISHLADMDLAIDIQQLLAEISARMSNEPIFKLACKHITNRFFV
ncbi:hypothetical protein [Chamaesiphon sp. GL140_3_metabinner_50]|uniref:hypothetical protein n=1 Tax=Chamaesiphon sp. GL140_3_metabinner_50 TaxID=2970812 RepID=UPI0025D0142C|nr:hypothetical protein [Chamaesiphon sp. GL140_3_metabinner_50]